MKPYQDLAFPFSPNQSVGGGSMMPDRGMTLRDYFAAKAMQGIVSDPNVTVGWEKTAAWAYSMADAMMEARK
jgi:hypothetical protein